MSEKKIVVPEGMLRAFRVEYNEPESKERVVSEWSPEICGLEAALRWLDEILHERNIDFHRAILKREQVRYPADEMGGMTSGMVMSHRVAFEYGVSFARNYIRDLFHAPEPQVPEGIKLLLANADIHEYHPVEKERVTNIALEAYRLGQKSK